MANIHLRCDRCHIIYNTGFNLAGRNITLSNINTVCPNCKSVNKIPDGIYDFIDSTINFINDSGLTLSTLLRIKKNLVNIQNQNLDVITIKNKIKKDVPELNNLSDTLPKTRNELYAFIVILLMVLGMAIDNISVGKKQPIEYNNFINNYNYNVEKSIQLPDTAAIKTKIQRNDPCHCGSGKKFKNCHGKH